MATTTTSTKADAETPPLPPFLGGAPSATHLVVLVHGLWGQPEHMHSIAHSLRERHPREDVYLLCAASITGTRTYDGVAHGGERVCAEVEAVMAAQKKEGSGGFDKISFIGYSMGGLVARYVVGLLEAKGVLAGLECMTFATFASPHLGARNPIPTIRWRLWNTIASTSIGEAGDHLFLHDTFRETSRPLLSVMADPSTVFLRGLRRFRRLTTYGNIINDRAVVWYSTAFSPTDPYADPSKVAVKYVEGYEGVLLQRGGGVVLRDTDKKKRRKRGLFGKKKDGCGKVAEKVPDVEGGSGDDTNGNYVGYDGEDPFEASWPWNMRLRLFTLLAIILTMWPIAIPIVSVTTAAANRASRRRMRKHDEGDDGVDTLEYRKLALFSDSPIDTTTTTEPSSPTTSSLSSDDNNNEETTAPLSQVFPSLNLPPAQLEMIEGLNALPWRKYPVWIRRHVNTHEDMVVRNFNANAGSEGHVVLRHFAHDEFLA